MTRAPLFASAMLLAACSGDGLFTPSDMGPDIAAPCGKAELGCCPGNVCVDGSNCIAGTCRAPPRCGQPGEPCCNGGACTRGKCVAGMCVGEPPPPGVTGEPCAKNADCAGTKPVCITTDAQGTPWPGGYCSSTCNPLKNDPQTGLNAACPGGRGTCIGYGANGACETACTEKSGAMPCARPGYSCFAGCEPTAHSQCDPTQKGSCGPGMSCMRAGRDDVGLCAPACDPFQQDCMNPGDGCYATLDSGEGACFPSLMMGGDGAPCQYLNVCNPGLSCYAAANQAGVCRPYCGGPNDVPCNNAHQCADLSPKVPRVVVGLCGG